MEIDYELTQQDFMEAYGAHRNRNTPMKWVRLIAFWLVIGFAAFLLYGSILAHNTRVLLPFFVLAILWLVVIDGVLPRRLLRGQYTKQPGARTAKKAHVGCLWNPLAMERGSRHVQWKNYIRTVEGEKQILFYTSPACFNILPKLALNPEQLNEFRTMLAQNIHAEK